MSNSEDTYCRTKKTKAVLDLFRFFKKFQPGRVHSMHHKRRWKLQQNMVAGQNDRL